MYFWTSLFITIPLIFSGILHMFSVRYNLFSVLTKPISISLFGANKTWRGLILMAFFTIPGVFLARGLEQYCKDYLLVSFWGKSAVITGILLGLGFMLTELPNSFIKRKLGIAPGFLPNKNRAFFFFMDQADSILGAAIVYYFYLNVPWQSLGILFLP